MNTYNNNQCDLFKDIHPFIATDKITAIINNHMKNEI